jgi:hypothetical protein
VLAKESLVPKGVNTANLSRSLRAVGANEDDAPVPMAAEPDARFRYRFAA